jgi:hypothetical protein
MLTAIGRTRVARIRARWKRWLHGRRSIVEFVAWHKQRRIAQDVGVSEQDLCNIRCSHPGPAELMPQRLRQLGVDPAFVELELPATYADLERVCATCKSWPRCSRDLSNNNVQAGMAGYCPNAFMIDVLSVPQRDWPVT